MKLYALELQLAVAQTHDYAVRRSGGDFKTGGKGFALDHQRMVPASFEAILESFKDCLAIVTDFRRLSVKQRRSPHHASAIDPRNCLVSQANAKNGNAPGKVLNHFHGHAGVIGRTRPRRNHDLVGGKLGFDVFHCNLIVSTHLHLLPQLAEILNEVVSERVVVVDDEKHFEILDFKTD